MTAVYKYIRGVTSREGKELLDLKDKVSARTDGYKLAVSKFRLDSDESCLQQEPGKTLGED